MHGQQNINISCAVSVKFSDAFNSKVSVIDRCILNHKIVVSLLIGPTRTRTQLRHL